MTQYLTKEEKQLLLVDLCARLPYGVILRNVKCEFDIKTDFIPTNIVALTELICEYNVKPYLRPMSSMTEEEILHIQALIRNKNHKLYDNIEECGIKGTPDWKLYKISYIETAEEVNYLNSRHLDWRGLIEKGLAIEAKEGMYNK